MHNSSKTDHDTTISHNRTYECAYIAIIQQEVHVIDVLLEELVEFAEVGTEGRHVLELEGALGLEEQVLQP